MKYKLEIHTLGNGKKRYKTFRRVSTGWPIWYWSSFGVESADLNTAMMWIDADYEERTVKLEVKYITK